MIGELYLNKKDNQQQRRSHPRSHCPGTATAPVIEQFTKCGLGARHLSPLFIYSSQWLYQSSVRPGPPDPSSALPSTSLCLFLQRILSEERACWFGVSLKYCLTELGAFLTQLTKIYLWCGSVSTQHSSLKEVKNLRKGLNLWSYVFSTKDFMFIFPPRDYKKETSKIRNFLKWPFISAFVMLG